MEKLHSHHYFSNKTLFQAIIALFFQVLDEDLVADTVCDANKDCQAPNARFREKCEAYRDCGNSSEPVFQCDSTFRRCLSVRQTRNCKYQVRNFRNLENNGQ